MSDRRRRVLPALMAASLLILGACSDDSQPSDASGSDASDSAPATGDGTVLHVRPGAGGQACTESDPCGIIRAAWDKAKPGDVIELEPGDYEKDVILGPEKGPPVDGGIEIRGTDRDRVVLRNVLIRAHDVKVHNVTITTMLRTPVTSGAEHVDGFELRDSTIRGGTALLNGMRDAVIANNEFVDGVNQDALNVKDDSDGVEITGNVFHDYRWDPAAPNAEIHVDCIQMFGVRNVTIKANRFDNCAQRAIILQVAAGNAFATSSVTIENNLIGGCTAGANCQNREVPFQATGPVSAAAQTEKGQPAPKEAKDYRIVNNLIEGYAYVEKLPGLIFANNIMQRYFNEHAEALACGISGVGNNLVAERGNCQALGEGDRLGSIEFLRDPVSTTSFDVTDPDVLAFADTSVAPDTDFYGKNACGARDVGPYELGC